MILIQLRILLRWILELCYVHYKKTLVFFILLLVVPFCFFKPLRIYLTVDELIDHDTKTSQEYFKLKKEFHLETNAFLVFEKKDSGALNSTELCEIKKWVTKTGLGVSNIRDSHSPLFLRKTTIDSSENGLRRLNFPNVVDLDCEMATVSDDPLSVLDSTPWQGLMSRKDHRDVVHDFQISSLGSDNFAAEKITPLMQGMMDSAKELPANMKVHWIGDAGYQYEMGKGLQYNNMLNLVLMVGILFLFRFLFGTWKSGFLYSGSLCYSYLVVIAFMSLTDTPIDLLNNSLFLMLALSCLGDFVFLAYHQLDNVKTQAHWMDTFRHLILPCFFTSFTTFIGFISLCSSDAQIIRRLGLWAAIGGIIEFAVMLLVLPAILKAFLKEKSWVNPDKVSSIFKWEIINKFSLHPYVTKGLLTLILFVPFTFNRLNVSDVPAELFKSGNPFRESINYLSDTRGFKGDVSLVFADKDNDEFNHRILAEIKNHPNVKRVEDPYEMLAFYTKDLADHEKDMMEEGLKETPQFRKFFSNDRIRAAVYLKETELKHIDQMRKVVNDQWCPKAECNLSGLLVAYADFSQSVPQTLISSFSSSFVMVFLTIVFVTFQTGNVRQIFSLTASAFWGIALLLIVICVLQVRINFVTCLVISILVGLMGDNTIQFILGGMDESLDKGIEERSTAAIITTFISIGASLIFMFHYFEPPQVFGLLLILGFFISLVGDLWILKGLLDKKKP